MADTPAADGPNALITGPGTNLRSINRRDYLYSPLMAFPASPPICSLSPHKSQHARNYRREGFLGCPSHWLLRCRPVRISSSLAPLPSQTRASVT